jgi:hypothetical protein
LRLGIAEAIQGGDAPLAQRRMGNYLYAVAADAIPDTHSTVALADPLDPLTGAPEIDGETRSGSGLA